MNTTSPTGQAAGPVGASAQQPPFEPKPRLNLAEYTLYALVCVIAIGVILYAWDLPPFRSPVQATEDAYVHGQVTIVSPQVNGYVTAVDVSDFQHVEPGELLASIDDRPYRQRVAEAEAQLNVARADLANYPQQQDGAAATVQQARAALQSASAQAVRTGADFRRIRALAGEQSLSERELDQARAADMSATADVQKAQATLRQAEANLRSVQVGRQSLEARVEQAQAALDQARLNLSYTRIVAPSAGRLGQVGVRLGAYVAAGTALMAVVPEETWVIANFKETQMQHLRVGQPATIAVDALGGHVLHGHVERISPGTGSAFSVLPSTNATGNFVKVVQRIPVRIALDPGQAGLDRIRPGMSVIARVDTTGGASRAGSGEAQP